MHRPARATRAHRPSAPFTRCCAALDSLKEECRCRRIYARSA
ncbi:hypothetical protein H9L17_01140 [Thermomonas brevis]|uniref:Bifunctional inhibitor/plant lipid transfer protein/seed storage helical domain-containing protein n=1 Tax=Thermomonas brevis TaxID=215691 RepID=A0A7G9QXI9_9GAMM|nr:hypothetical protein H9L17_01140 [Thermomonas brevis]